MRRWSTRLGAVLLVLGSVQFLVAHLVAENAWEPPRYSWWTTYISDLGAVSCGPVLGVRSPAHAVMNTGFVVQGAFLLVGVILTADAWAASGRRRVWQTMVGLAGVSWIVTADRPVVRATALVAGIIGLAGFVLTALAIGNSATIGIGFAERVTVFPLQIWAPAVGIGIMVRPRKHGSAPTIGLR